MAPVKPYRSIPIRECGEALTIIPRDAFAFYDPHPYVALGAPYGDANPWMLRPRVLYALQRAQKKLEAVKPGWKILMFDAYRPNAVQAFMVENELKIQAKADGLDAANLTSAEREKLLAKVYLFWGIPSEDPQTPPSHSTGAAIDVTLADENGNEVDMGSPIDENSPRSYADHFATAIDDARKIFNDNRELLNGVLQGEGFRRHPQEWWHFSRGDQFGVWLEHGLGNDKFAIYGRADLIKAPA